jgi:hypothetical protein
MDRLDRMDLKLVAMLVAMLAVAMLAMLVAMLVAMLAVAMLAMLVAMLAAAVEAAVAAAASTVPLMTSAL